MNYYTYIIYFSHFFLQLLLCFSIPTLSQIYGLKKVIFLEVILVQWLKCIEVTMF